MPRPYALSVVILALAGASSAWSAGACEVRLLRAVPLCPSVVHHAEDCGPDVWGKRGERLTVPATIHRMESGRSFYCPSHEACVDAAYITVSGCSMKPIPRQPGESREYRGHVVVGD